MDQSSARLVAVVVSALAVLGACPPTATPGPTERVKLEVLPVAVIDPSSATREVGQPVIFDGSRSFDPEGSMLGHSWTLRAAAGGSEAQPKTGAAPQMSLVPDRSGFYAIELIVSAGERVSGAALAVLTVAEATTLVANAGVDLARSSGQWVILDGTGSRDPQGGTLGYQWSFAEIPAGSTAELFDATTATPRFLPDVEGSYALNLEVRVGARSATDDMRVTVGPVNHAPNAIVSAGQRVAIGDSVQLDGGASWDPDGDAITLEWAVVSKPKNAKVVLTDTTGRTPSFVVTVGGFYSFQLTVTDARGLTGRALARVIASPGASQTDAFDPDEVYFHAQVSQTSCYRFGVAHWLTPESAATGFNCYFNQESNAAIRPTDGRLLYMNGDERLVREFHCDTCPYAGVYPSQVLANDPVILTPCDVSGLKVVDFKVSPQGLLLHTCVGTPNAWRDNTGSMVYDASAVALHSVGYSGWILTQASVLNTGTGVSSLITGLPARTWVASRAMDAQTFWVALAPASATSAPELWTVSTQGVAQLVGSYPPMQSGYLANEVGRLDGSGALFARGTDYTVPGGAAVLIRRTVGASTDPVYSELDNPLVKLGGWSEPLITGP